MVACTWISTYGETLRRTTRKHHLEAGLRVGSRGFYTFPSSRRWRSSCQRPAVAQTPSYQTLYSFKGSPDGADPRAAVIIGRKGALYGTTFEGGASAHGTVFVLNKPAGEPWKESVLLGFNGSDGQYPESPLVFGSTGALYGTTTGGGGGSSTGVAFELAPPSTAGGAWAETLLYIFRGSPSNAVPNGPLLFGPGGTIYTTTEGAITYGFGQIIALTPPTTPGGAWTESVLLSFDLVPGAAYPTGSLVSEGGSLFGTTLYGGEEGCFDFGCGVVFELTPPTAPGGAWTETMLHTFGEVPDDGIVPMAPLTIGPGGVLYGTTYYGGTGVCYTSGGLTSGCGTVFQLTPPSASGAPWTYSVIHDFTGADGDGAAPVAGVVVGKNGAIYGTTLSAGSTASDSACPASYYVIAGCGIVFELTPPSTPGGAWTETVLHSFSGQDGDGATSQAALTLSSSGVLYGTTAAGGTAGKGTVFSLVP
jgi:uncharacterized repeat protein (TIGR03803 family)